MAGVLKLSAVTSTGSDSIDFSRLLRWPGVKLAIVLLRIVSPGAMTAKFRYPRAAAKYSTQATMT